MLSDEEREAIDYLQLCYDLSTITNESLSKLGIVLNLIENLIFKTETQKELLKYKTDKIEKQSKEIEELKETLKCTQNSWFEDTQKIEEMKKQIDLDNECEIALNNRIMDLENNDKKWKDKIKEKIEKRFLEAKGLHERGVQPQAQYTMKLLRDLEKSLLEKE